MHQIVACYRSCIPVARRWMLRASSAGVFALFCSIWFMILNKFCCIFIYDGVGLSLKHQSILTNIEIGIYDICKEIHCSSQQALGSRGTRPRSYLRDCWKGEQMPSCLFPRMVQNRALVNSRLF